MDAEWKPRCLDLYFAGFAARGLREARQCKGAISAVDRHDNDSVLESKAGGLR